MKRLVALFFILVFLFGFNAKAEDFKAHDKYSITTYKSVSYKENSVSHWIESGGEKITELAGYEIYDDGRKLRLISKLGFTFDNIPYQKGKEHFFNEAVYCFIDAEKYLPLAEKCLRGGGFNIRAVSTVKLKFPDNAEINPITGTTRFKWRDIWVVGLTPAVGGNTAYVTWGPGKYHDNIAAHEYIHMCGYANDDHGKKVFECAKEILNR